MNLRPLSLEGLIILLFLSNWIVKGNLECLSTKYIYMFKFLKSMVIKFVLLLSLLIFYISSVVKLMLVIFSLANFIKIVLAFRTYSAWSILLFSFHGLERSKVFWASFLMSERDLWSLFSEQYNSTNNTLRTHLEFSSFHKPSSASARQKNSVNFHRQ